MELNNSIYKIGDQVNTLVGDRIYVVDIIEKSISNKQIVYELFSEDANEYRGLYNEQQWEDDQIGDALAEYEKILVAYQDILKEYPVATTLKKEQVSEIRKKVRNSLER